MNAAGTGPLIAVILSTVAVGCGSSPTAPKNGPTAITLSEASATVARHTTLQLTAQVQTQNGTSSDITQGATWSTSNPAVATVTAGLVSVDGLGPVQISVSYQGLSATSTMTGRRRMVFSVRFDVQDSAGAPSIDGLSIRLDGKEIIAEGQSGRIFRASVIARGNAPADSIDPGSHQMEVGLQLEPGTHDLRVAPTTLTLSDSDTGEVMTAIPLGGQQGAKTNQQTFSWSIEVAAFTQ